MGRMTRFVFLLVLLVALAAPLVAADPIALQLQLQQAERPIIAQVARPGVKSTPLVVQSPGTIEIEIKIVPTADTEELRVTADSGNHYRRSAIRLAGRDSQKVYTFEWHGFPVGEYEVVGELITSSGRREVVVRGALRVIE